MRLLIPPPLWALIFAGLIWLSDLYLPQFSFEFTGQAYVAGVLFFIGVMIDILSMRLFAKAKTTVNPFQPQNSKALVTTGIYAYTRNPMYLAMIFFLCAFGIWVGSWMFMPIVVVFVWLISELQIKAEESVLSEKFGEEYTRYCQSVRRWV
ncbi:MAG: isoprenylcysteine carboxylmethyltransferase family protein [Pseudomonadota bacterium]